MTHILYIIQSTNYVINEQKININIQVICLKKVFSINKVNFKIRRQSSSIFLNLLILVHIYNICWHFTCSCWYSKYKQQLSLHVRGYFVVVKWSQEVILISAQKSCWGSWHIYGRVQCHFLVCLGHETRVSKVRS